MSEATKPGPSSGGQPELTHKQQQAQDQERVQGQLVVTDVTRQVQSVMDVFSFGSSGSSGRTSFEGHDLNAMIDLIENSNPENLEEAGRALFKARTAITDASKELSGFIEAVDWEGESGTAFRDWGNGLVAHAEKLGEFAEAAGTQITVAGTGLASVRKSLPPRDGRLIRKDVEDIEAPKRIEGNPEYVAALKVEKDRQEAINQANRLASYYSVSEEALAGQEPPRFGKKLDVKVPRPLGYIDPGPGSSPAGSEALGNGTVGAVSEPAVGSHSGSGNSDGRAGVETGGSISPVLDKGTSTEINTATSPPAPVTAPSPSAPAPPSPAGPAGPDVGSAPPMTHRFGDSTTRDSRRPTGPTGLPRATGLPRNGVARAAGPAGSGPTEDGRTGAPVGRPAPMGGGSGSGTAGRPAGTSSQSPIAGRPGATGGSPTAGSRGSASGSASPRAGRANGITGGAPQRATPGAARPGGVRGVLRGTVIGAEPAAQARGSADGVSQRGAVGAGGGSSITRPSGPVAPSSNGVVGKPRGGVAGPGSSARGFTAGGAGLVRGPSGRGNSDDEDQNSGSKRTDYLTEDEETWATGRRGAVPPVIE